MRKGDQMDTAEQVQATPPGTTFRDRHGFAWVRTDDGIALDRLGQWRPVSAQAAALTALAAFLGITGVSTDARDALETGAPLTVTRLPE